MKIAKSMSFFCDFPNVFHSVLLPFSGVRSTKAMKIKKNRKVRKTNDIFMKIIKRTHGTISKKKENDKE